MTEPLIEFKNVSKKIAGKVVLDKTNLRILPKEVSTIIGKSGAGKSVTLKLIIGLMEPDEGEIFYKGKGIKKMSRHERGEMKSQVNFMFQNNALFDSMNIFENIALPLREKLLLPEKEVEQRVHAKMKDLDLLEIDEKFPSQLSGGMQKRVALARALVTDPQVVLFDEPTTGLDPVRKKNVLSMITHNQKNFGFSAVLVSHDVPDVFYISNNIAIIEQGKFIFQGSPTELEQSRLQEVSDFINSLERLENEIVGLDTRRELEMKYQAFLESGFSSETWLILLKVENIERIKERVGQMISHNILSALAHLLRENAGEEPIIGRFSQDKIVCIMSADRNKVRKLCENIGSSMSCRPCFQKKNYQQACYDFSLNCGVAECRGELELQDLVDSARENEQVLASLVCGKEFERGFV